MSPPGMFRIRRSQRGRNNFDIGLPKPWRLWMTKHIGRSLIFLDRLDSIPTLAGLPDNWA